MRSFFEPQILLTKEPDGQYTLDAVTLAPNSCYGAGRAERGAPPNVRLLPEVEPLLLHIKHRGGRCLQVIKPLRHHLENLKLGQVQGKTTLTAFVMLGSSVVGSASVDVTHLFPITAGDDKDEIMPIDTSDWYAWINAMPGPQQKRTLHVTGVVTVPSPGYEARLVPKAPQGINPKDLILDLELETKIGVFPQVVTPLSVAYETAAAIAYTSVLVRLPDGSGIQLEVDEVV